MSFRTFGSISGLLSWIGKRRRRRPTVLRMFRSSHNEPRVPRAHSSYRSPSSSSDATRAPTRNNRRAHGGGSGATRHLRFEPFPHRGQGVAACLETSKSSGSQTEMSLRSAAAFRRGIAEPRRDIALFFKAVERAIQGADGQRAAGPRFDLAPDGDPVGPLAEPEDCEQDDVL